MCEKCVELDKKIERYRRIGLAMTDELTIDRIKELVADMSAQKVKFHPEKN
jgi:hypothetical protein